MEALKLLNPDLLDRSIAKEDVVSGCLARPNKRRIEAAGEEAYEGSGVASGGVSGIDGPKRGESSEAAGISAVELNGKDEWCDGRKGKWEIGGLKGKDEVANGNEEDGDQKMLACCSRFSCTINEREWQQATHLWTGTM
ncbi:unnamed protein product [Lactuca saligna]|uniref:Uncharacterized protein n=1 Tax=Lactuca saligna TaxID=75948 RepID=A0AA35ZFV9_LACSI|nr:unnamed protein product [Lactuca saligna]